VSCRRAWPVCCSRRAPRLRIHCSPKTPARRGAGNFQLELTYERFRDEDGDTRVVAEWAAAVLSYGVRDDLDAIVTLPYGRIRSDTPDDSQRVQGTGDLGLDLKWRFFEHEATSVALKPGMTFSTGDLAEELGSGRQRASAYLIATIDPKPWAVHLHLGYLWNANLLGERTNLWHVSIGGWVWFQERWRLVADVGSLRNVDPESARNPAFATGGIIYSATPDLDIDLGIRRALTAPENDSALLAGVTMRF
jgi:hypothetical protein